MQLIGPAHPALCILPGAISDVGGKPPASSHTYRDEASAYCSLASASSLSFRPRDVVFETWVDERFTRLNVAICGFSSCSQATNLAQTPCAIPPRVRWTRTVCLTRRKSVSQTGLHLRRASASCSSARALLNLKRQPQRLSRLLGWKHHQLLPKPRRLHKLKRKRPANLHRRLWIPPLNRHRYRRTRTPLPRRNRRQPRERISFPLLPAPAQFQAPLRSLFRRKPCRLLTSNFKTHCEFGGCIQRNCYTTR